MSLSRKVLGMLSALLLSGLISPAAAAAADVPASRDGFVVSKGEYNRMFPHHKKFYSYASLRKAMKKFPAFAHTGSPADRKREAAAFLANVSHETGGLKYIIEQNTANFPHYCDDTQPFGCPAGRAEYYGRGPIQLSWNFNYKAAGDALGIDLLRHPSMVQKKPVVAWKTALWFWMKQTGAGTMTGHHAMVSGAGFGQTIRTINGAIECDGGNPAQVRSRVAEYNKFARILQVAPGGNKSC
ncbi:chitinase [Streptomyces sp. BH-SS-21]|uniref:Chitinase n=1 Tax=Streptomyces liliiviolaceus TaxID=2823109 RepID=A0A941BDF2_9ACTN|nr:chitinase [Streptomyces liliiviolaceus]MBQ0849434.1 chitinase [Streptomyces liliiviolaceus]